MNRIPFRVDKKSPVPIYHQIQAAITEMIKRGQLNPHERVPSENELSEQFAVSPMTVRQAMAGLVQEGLVYRKRGTGTFVGDRHMDHSLEKLTGFSEDMHERGLTPSARILLFERIVPARIVSSALEMDPAEEVLHIKRLRFSDGKPVGLHDTYLAPEVEISRDELEETNSLYVVLETKYGKMKSGIDTIEAVEASEELSELLGIRPGAALLRITRVTEDHSGKPLEFVIATYRADLYRYKIRLDR